MATTERYRLADPDKRIPMPDRGGQLFPADDRGRAVDAGDRFYAALIADGDLVKVEKPAAPKAGSRKGK